MIADFKHAGVGVFFQAVGNRTQSSQLEEIRNVQCVQIRQFSQPLIDIDSGCRRQGSIPPFFDGKRHNRAGRRENPQLCRKWGRASGAARREMQNARMRSQGSQSKQEF